MFREKLRQMEWETTGRAMLEYSGIPLALYMGVGVLFRVLQGQGMYIEFLDPGRNLYLYFIANVWLVAGVYTYRQRRSALLLDQKYELVAAAASAFTWLVLQPVMLLFGYGIYMIAVMREDQLHPFLHNALLPDLDNVEEDPEPSKNTSTGQSRFRSIRNLLPSIR